MSRLGDVASEVLQLLEQEVELHRSKGMYERKEREPRSKDGPDLISEEKLRLRRHQDDLRRLMKAACLAGSVSFRGNDRSPGDRAVDVGRSAAETLGEVLPDVFERFGEAAARTGDLKKALDALFVAENLQGLPAVFSSLGLLRDEKGIDPRCAQIAALALWLRAQRAYRDFGVSASERPRINRTHIVVAEPMPGDESLVEAFAADLEPPLLRDLFKKMVAEMRLAGELGSLIRVDKGIGDELHRAREEFTRQREPGDYLPGLSTYRVQSVLDLSEIEDAGFFEEAETLLLSALRRFAESSTGGAGVRRKLFADDAEQGIALIDLLRTKFDVVLMNPPFGACSAGAKKEFEKSYPRTKNDLYAAFVERGVELLQTRGMLGAITSRTGFFLSSFQEWREDVLLKRASLTVVADLGAGVLDSAMVEVAAYCLERAV